MYKFVGILDNIVHFNSVQPQGVRGPTNYQNEIVDLYEAAIHEGVEKGRRFTRWRFIRDMEKDLTPRLMENIEPNVRTRQAAVVGNRPFARLASESCPQSTDGGAGYLQRRWH